MSSASHLGVGVGVEAGCGGAAVGFPGRRQMRLLWRAASLPPPHHVLKWADWQTRQGRRRLLAGEGPRCYPGGGEQKSQSQPDWSPGEGRRVPGPW